MDTKNIYDLLFQIFYEDIKLSDVAKSTHDINNARIYKNYLLNKEAERKKYEIKKKVIRDRSEKTKLSNIDRAIKLLSHHSN